MASPYPWYYTLRWPWYYRFPSLRQRTSISRKPLYHAFREFDPNHLQRLLFCGDIMIMQHDKIPILCPELQALIGQADWFIGNCEAAVGSHALNSKAHYKFTFHMPRLYLESIMQQTALKPERWLLSMANNHTGDAGYQGCLETYPILSDMGVVPMGRWQPGRLPMTIVKRDGIKMGIIAWTDWMNCEVFPAKDPGAVRRQHVLEHNWRQIKKQHQLDLLIALPHWEYEFQHFPHKASQGFAHHLFNQHDINLLVGIHTHTLQPMEWINQGICQYNLGNFCGLGVAWPVRLISLLEVMLDCRKDTKGNIVAYRLHPFVQINTKEKIEIVSFKALSHRKYNRFVNRLNCIFDVDTQEDI